jgi:hypothetical protein
MKIQIFVMPDSETRLRKHSRTPNWKPPVERRKSISSTFPRMKCTIGISVILQQSPEVQQEMVKYIKFGG